MCDLSLQVLDETCCKHCSKITYITQDPNEYGNKERCHVF